MPTLLKIDASPRGDYSVSRKLTGIFTETWLKSNAGGAVVERDLFKTDLPFVDVPWMMGAFTPAEQHSEESAKAIKVSDALVDELLAADEVLIGTPMYNFAAPAVLKAYIDHIVRVGRTVSAKYEGLVTGKKLTIIVASGGVYTPGSHMEGYNAETTYLKQVFGFIGFTDINFVLAGGSNGLNTGETTLEALVESFTPEVVAAAQ